MIGSDNDTVAAVAGSSSCHLLPSIDAGEHGAVAMVLQNYAL